MVRLRINLLRPLRPPPWSAKRPAKAPEVEPTELLKLPPKRRGR